MNAGGKTVHYSTKNDVLYRTVIANGVQTTTRIAKPKYN